ncbi:MAG: NADH:ubiquinone reductase (Na(+)-transporting) subunit A, partial [Prevotella sp.]|nr:NADH:ubiquinone reductase (Na(+)-transporting) subunit A [Prevotella sp.]
VSALRDMPLAGDFEFEVKGQEADFQTGLEALSKIAKVYVGVGKDSQLVPVNVNVPVEYVVFSGKCPAGNVGVQVNHLDPVNKGEVVWTVDPTAVLFFGRLFNTGKVNLTRTLALAGSEVENPAYFDALVGAQVSLNELVKADKTLRIIAGNPLTGKPQTGATVVVGAHCSEITVIPEGDHADEIFGWIMPRFKQFSVSRSYFSWLFPKKDGYVLDARVKGGERHMIMSGEYDKVLPMDIYGEFLIKAIIAQDIDKMEALGIYEVSPEDFALAEFVDSSKLELQKIVREGLNMLRKENE